MKLKVIWTMKTEIYTTSILHVRVSGSCAVLRFLHLVVEGIQCNDLSLLEDFPGCGRWGMYCESSEGSEW